MTYLAWLLVISAFFALVERLRPARPAQPVFRKQLLNDLVYLVFNGHVYSIVTTGIVLSVANWTRLQLDALGILPASTLLTGKPLIVQALVYFVVSDFLQWCVHNLLHRVPFLWQFHKLHHSVKEMDWAANFRFHWMEHVVYKSLLYVPLLFLGGEFEALFWVYVAGTFWGHFNHSNLNVSIGPLRYLFNSPRMHMWHHDQSTEGGPYKNFGIVLSLWDWIFGTVFWPRERPPQAIGYAGEEELPRNLLGQFAFPLARRRAE